MPARLRRKLLLCIAHLYCLGLFSLCLVAALAISHSSFALADLTGLLAMRVKVGNLLIFLAFLLVASAVFAWPARLFESHRLSTWQRRVGEAMLAASLLSLCLLAARQPLALDFATPLFLGSFWVLLTSGLIVSRELCQLFLRTARARGRNLRQVVVVAAREPADDLLQLLASDRPNGFRVAAVLRPTADPARVTSKLRVVVRNQPVDEVFISLPVDTEQPALPRLLDVCDEQGILVRLHALERTGGLSHLYFDRLANLPLLTLRPGPPDDWRVAAKRAFDVLGSAALLLILAPLLAFLALIIKLDSTGPVFFRQRRLGLNKRRFAMLKFRTMVDDAESQLALLESQNEADGAAFKMRDDPRVTSVGWWLRRFSLDELPQLINVLMGEMSLVGPRPLPQRDAERISVAWHRRRFSVKPGLTCLWQISGRSDLSFDRWIRLDLEYIDGWSLALDLKILAQTLPAVVRGSGAY